MQINQLKNNEIFCSPAGEYWVHCAGGMIWLSQNGQDMILRCGQKWQAQKGDKLLIQALEESRFALHHQAELSLPEQVGFFSRSPQLSTPALS